MRAVKKLLTIIIPLLAAGCALLNIQVAHSMEFDLQLEQTAWHYKEYEKNTALYVTKLPSAAQGKGALAKLRWSSERDLDYFLAVSASLMDSTAWAQETWGTSQTNALKIKQQDIRIDAQYRWLDARWGVWLSQRIQTQQRQNFYLNRVLTPQKNEPIPEVITSQWFGLSLASIGGNQQQFETTVEVAMPINVKVTNPLFAQPFSKKTGQRAGVHMRWLLPQREIGLAGFNLTLRLEYQVLGGETQATGGFWPYNRWLMASAGMLYAW